MDDNDLPTTVTITRGVLADLRVVKAEMSKRQGRTMFMPEVMANLISCWQERPPRETQRIPRRAEPRAITTARLAATGAPPRVAPWGYCPFCQRRIAGARLHGRLYEVRLRRHGRFQEDCEGSGHIVDKGEERAPEIAAKESWR